MNSPTITMERDSAIQKLEEYEAAAKFNPRAMRTIDKGLMDGYRALAKGKRLVDVNAAIRAGGLNLAGIPLLAIARAHVQSVAWRPNATIGKSWNGKSWSVRSNGNFAPDGGGLFDYGKSSSMSDSCRITDDRAFWQIPKGTFFADKIAKDARGFVRDFRAMTPLVPLPLRPKYKLENYFLLWEANWHPEPPRDPYLLRPITGSLMEIIAEWDLTDLEIAAVRNAAR